MGVSTLQLCNEFCSKLVDLTNYTSQGGNLAGGSQGGYLGVAWG